MQELGISFAQKLGALGAWISNPITLMLLLPLLGALLISLTPTKDVRRIRFFAVLFTSLTLLVGVLMLTGVPQGLRDSVPALAQYQPFRADAGFQYTLPADSYRWMSIEFGEEQSFSVNYNVGIDGISMPLVLMTAAIMLLCALWGMPRRERLREYFALFLVLESALLGIFVALDFVLFYLFWELMLLPMYFLIAGWGKHRERAEKAAIKFFIFTMTGSVFFLISFIFMQILSGAYSFSILDIMQQSLAGGMSYVPFTMRLMMFLGLLIGFAVKVPMFPFHTWLPDAHTEAPTEMSVILAALMLKTGSYAFLRILYPCFPDVAYQFGPVIAFCAVVAIVYGAAITLVQTDFKRMVAYSSISHMGFIVLGIASMNVDAQVGAVFHMVGHGIIIAALFFLSGVLEERYGTRDLRQIAGLRTLAPAYAAVLAIAAFAAMGFPLMMGFWGEFLILKGTFYNNPVWQSIQVGPMDGSTFLQWCAGVSIIGILTSAVYMINMLSRVLAPETRLPVLVPEHGSGGILPPSLQPAQQAENQDQIFGSEAGPQGQRPDAAATGLDVELIPAPVTDQAGNVPAPWRGFKPNHGFALVALTAAMVLFFAWPTPIKDSCEKVLGNLYLVYLSK